MITIRLPGDDWLDIIQILSSFAADEDDAEIDRLVDEIQRQYDKQFQWR